MPFTQLRFYADAFHTAGTNEKKVVIINCLINQIVMLVSGSMVLQKKNIYFVMAEGREKNND